MQIKAEHVVAMRAIEQHLRVLGMMRGGVLARDTAGQSEDAFFRNASALLRLHAHPIVGRLLHIAVTAVRQRDAESIAFAGIAAASAAEILDAVASSRPLKKGSAAVQLRPLTNTQSKYVNALTSNKFDVNKTAAQLHVTRQAVEKVVKKAKERQPGLVTTRIRHGRQKSFRLLDE